MTPDNRFISTPDVVARRSFVTPPDEVVRRTVELAEVPAPTGLEAARQERVRTWWLEDGWADVHPDEVGNLWARVRDGEGPAVVICAHLDTVFDDTVDHRVTTGGGEHTPGEWIDTAQLGTGLRCAAATITGWERGAREGGGS